ncbi:MAG: hypothetical protein HP497_12325, partial [Nitrospira sp.]|nr:hypothetical protein [Nitrospira sp.]
MDSHRVHAGMGHPVSRSSVGSAAASSGGEVQAGVERTGVRFGFDRDHAQVAALVGGQRQVIAPQS